MVVGVLRLELRVHGSQSLKEKRAVVKSILGRCRVRFPVSCAEIDHQNLWQRASLGFAILENNDSSAHQVLQKVIEEVERIGLAEIVGQDIELIHYG